MAYIDKRGRVCGFLDIEEKEGSGVYSRRFFILDKSTKMLEYYMDNPINFTNESIAMGSFNMQFVSMVSDVSKSKPKGLFFFTLTVNGRNHYLAASDPQDKANWIKHFTDACKITVDAEVFDDEQCDSIGSYTAEICGGVVHRIPLEGQADSDFDSSCDELEKEDLAIPHGRPNNLPEPIKFGFCIKQGALRKNWKRRFFILDADGISYYKSKDEKSPIKHITKSEIVEARISVGIHLNKDHLFELVTPHRVFYIQAESDEDRDSWIFEINKLSGHPIVRKTRSDVEFAEGERADPSVLLYHRQLSELSTHVKLKDMSAGYSSTL